MSRGVLGWIVFILFSLMLVMMVMTNINSKTNLTYNDFRKQLTDHNIAKATIREDAIIGELVEAETPVTPSCSQSTCCRAR